jgi:hemerythrin-like metal-binding protein
MPLFVWSEEYSTGNTMMDNQHKKWFGYVQDLYDAMQVGKGKDALEPLLKALIEYTHTHFKAEEDLLRSSNYPGLAEQVAEHAKFTKTVEELQEKYLAGQAALSIETSRNLKDWLFNHIMGMDMKYKPHLKVK